MSVRYLLDTNICIYIAKRRPPEVAGRFERLRPGEVGMSMITYGELLLGAEKSQHTKQAGQRLQRFVELVPVLALPDESRATMPASEPSWNAPAHRSVRTICGSPRMPWRLT
jgi:tRNA(fMet)-specific endonuclease VapC